MTERRGRPVMALALLSLLLLAGAALAQGLDVTGTWSVQMLTVARGTAVLGGCSFQGTTTVNQTGSQFTGGIDVTLTSGPPACPSAMSANLSGEVSGNQLNMGAVMGNGALGTATFTGTLASAVNAGSTINGTFTVTSGNFTGTGGTWTATSLAPVAAVPVLGARGLALLAVLLLASALWLLWRRSAARAR